MRVDHRANLLRVYREALRAVNGRDCVRRYLEADPLPPPVHVVAIGKAAAHMAAGAFDALHDGIDSALVITKRGHCEPLLPEDRQIVCLESSHPIPDAASVTAGRALVDRLDEVPPDAHLLFLVSGGASSLVEVLPEAMDLQGLERMNRWLMASGLPIDEVNRVRKRVSLIKAGRLARHLKGRETLNLLLSDVAGDDARAIGSGLLVPHGPESVDVGGIHLPEWLRHLTADAPATLGPDAFRSIRTRIIAGPARARDAAAEAATATYPVHVHSEPLDGDAAAAGRHLVRAALSGPPGLHVWSGETTMHLPPKSGRGGRCQHLALASAVEIQGRIDVWLLAAGTDGTDGPGEDAGALVDGGTLERGRAFGLDAERALEKADAGTFLEAAGDLIHTGPTGTNVADLVLALKSR